MENLSKVLEEHRADHIEDAKGATFHIAEVARELFAPIKGKVSEDTYLKAVCSFSIGFGFLNLAQSYSKDKVKDGQVVFTGEMAELMATMVGLAHAHTEVAKNFGGLN